MQNREIIEYKIVHVYLYDEISKVKTITELNNLIKEGWQPFGEIINQTDSFLGQISGNLFQVMVKYKQKNA